MILFGRLLVLTVLFVLILAGFTLLVPFIFLFWMLRGLIRGYLDGALFVHTSYRTCTKAFTSTWKLWNSIS